MRLPLGGLGRQVPSRGPSKQGSVLMLQALPPGQAGWWHEREDTQRRSNIYTSLTTQD